MLLCCPDAVLPSFPAAALPLCRAAALLRFRRPAAVLPCWPCCPATCRAAALPRCPAATLPRCHAAVLPRCQPRCHAAPLPRCRAAPLPCCPAACPGEDQRRPWPPLANLLTHRRAAPLPAAAVPPCCPAVPLPGCPAAPLPCCPAACPGETRQSHQRRPYRESDWLCRLFCNDRFFLSGKINFFKISTVVLALQQNSSANTAEQRPYTCLGTYPCLCPALLQPPASEKAS